MKKTNNRKKTFISISLSALLIVLILVLNIVITDDMVSLNAEELNKAPSFRHLFGTDWLGRDMFNRTIKALNTSISLALITAAISVAIAVFLSFFTLSGSKWLDNIISWLVDVFIAMPHLVFMLLLSFAVGGGRLGVIVAVGFTHWPRVYRLLKMKLMSIKKEDYIEISRQMGKTNKQIFFEHIVVHILNTLILSFVLLFPHAILHEAALSFLGFGLNPNKPAMGVILSEGMNSISTGAWYLIVYPSALLIIIVKSFDNIGEKLSKLIEPRKAQE